MSLTAEQVLVQGTDASSRAASQDEGRPGKRGSTGRAEDVIFREISGGAYFIYAA